MTRKQERLIIRAAQWISAITSPFYMALVVFVVLLTCSYLRLLPWAFKAYLLALVAVFTVGLPKLSIWLYQKVNGWHPLWIHVRQNRVVPYLLTMCSYTACYWLLDRVLHMPYFISGVIMAALMLQALCTIINFWWKISAHLAAAGGMISTLLCYSFIFSYNPVWWFSGALLLAGSLGSSRLILRRHTLAEVAGGFLVGFACGIVGVLMV